MTNKEIAASVKDKYTRALVRSPAAARFYAKLRDGTATMTDVLKFSDVAADTLTETFGIEFRANFPNGIPMDAVSEIVPDGLRKNCMDVLDASRVAVTAKNKKAGSGIQGMRLDPDGDRIDGLTKHMSENLVNGELPANTKSLIRNLANSEVDRSIKENVKFLDASGMKTTVTRIYSGKGLRDGPCQWCIDREGTDVPVGEAEERGMFARHEGCGCQIDYKTEKGTQRQTDWTHNKWADKPEVLEARKQIGL